MRSTLKLRITAQFQHLALTKDALANPVFETDAVLMIFGRKGATKTIMMVKTRIHIDTCFVSIRSGGDVCVVKSEGGPGT